MISSKDVPDIASYLEANIEAGLTVSTIFKMAARNHKKYANDFHYIASELEAGRALADALYDVDLFDVVIIEQIRAGENSGKLAEAFASINEISEQKNTLSGELKSSLIMPVATLAISLVSTFFMMGYVLPNLTESFGNQKSAGAFIQFCLGISELIGEQYYLYGVFAVFVTFGTTYLLTSEKIASKIGELTSSLQALSSYHFGIWSSFMSMLQTSGVDIANSVKLCKSILPQKLAKPIDQIFSDITDAGLDYADALNELNWSDNDPRFLIPENVRIALKIGGSTGRMDISLKKVSKRSIKAFNKNMATMMTLTKIIIPFLVAIPVFMIIYVFMDVFTAGLSNVG